MSLSLFAIGGLSAMSQPNVEETIDPLLESGRESFLNYDFDSARDAYARYAAKQRKSRQEVDVEYDVLTRQLDIAVRQIERVQDIVIIDSLSVNAADFFKHIKVPASAGYLLSPVDIPFKEGRESASMAFTPESQAVMLWAQPDSTGTFRVVESLRLTDGSYAEPVYADEMLNNGGDVDFPILCADGLTIYFSSDGEGSMGGYDIFETVRDAQTGEYLPPSNVGMPFNSPYDDFLLITDEENGVGWWATDRNKSGDQITLYVYMLPDIRRNFEGDEEETVARARVSDFKATWTSSISDDEEADTPGSMNDGGDEEADINRAVDYAAKAAEIRRVKPGTRPRVDEFYLPVNGGKIYTRYDQLPDANIRNAVKKYFETLSDFEKQSRSLYSDRLNYDKSRDGNLGLRIKQQEQALEAAREQLRQQLIGIYRILR